VAYMLSPMVVGYMWLGYMLIPGCPAIRPDLHGCDRGLLCPVRAKSPDCDTLETEGIEMTRWGYGRVSTRDQNTEVQYEALVAAGVDPAYIRVEKASTRMDKRPVLEEVRALLKAGDTLVITKIDRLSRSLLDLITIANDLRDNKHVELGAC
jgi:hypothetical protein